MKYKVTGYAMIPVAVEMIVDSTSPTQATNQAKTRLMMDPNKADYLKVGQFDQTQSWDLRKPMAVEVQEPTVNGSNPAMDSLRLCLE